MTNKGISDFRLVIKCNKSNSSAGKYNNSAGPPTLNHEDEPISAFDKSSPLTLGTLSIKHDIYKYFILLI